MRKFWKKFGRVLKEGASFDFDNKDKLLAIVPVRVFQ